MLSGARRPVRPSLPTGPPPRPPISLKGFVKKILNDRTLGFGSLLAYTFVIALLPLATAALGIFGLVLGDNPSAKESIVNSIVDAVSDESLKTSVRQVAEKATENLGSGAGGILAIGIIFALWGGSRLFVAIDETLTIFFRTPDRGFVKKNLIAIGMLLLFILLILLIIGASGAPSFLINALPDQNGAQFGIFIAGIIVSLLLSFLLFLPIYWLIPNKKTKFKHVWCGALVAAIFLMIFLVLFPLYIRRFMNSSLGLIGFAVILITFFYYFSVILLLGAQINAYFFERIQPLPDGLGTFVHQTVNRLLGGPTVPVRKPN